MDILARRGELSPSEIAGLEGLSQADLIDLVIGMNKGWYQLLEHLEESHRQDLQSLQQQLVKEFEKVWRTTRESEHSELSRLETALIASRKQYADGLEVAKASGEKLSALQKVLGKYASGSRA